MSLLLLVVSESLWDVLPATMNGEIGIAGSVFRMEGVFQAKRVGKKPLTLEPPPQASVDKQMPKAGRN